MIAIASGCRDRAWRGHLRLTASTFGLTPFECFFLLFFAFLSFSWRENRIVLVD